MGEETWRGPLFELKDGGRGPEVPDSEATIRRSEDRIEYSIKTSGLTPGNAYTVWVMAFNNPAACSGEGAPKGFRCGGADMGNAEAGFSLVWGGDGKFAESDSLDFAGSVVKGERSGVEFDGPGVTDPLTAEIHLRIRDHGPAQPGLEEEQIKTIGGGCTDESTPPGGSGKRGAFDCRDVQATGM